MSAQMPAWVHQQLIPVLDKRYGASRPRNIQPVRNPFAPRPIEQPRTREQIESDAILGWLNTAERPIRDRTEDRHIVAWLKERQRYTRTGIPIPRGTR